MRPPRFWTEPPSHPLGRLLAPAGAIYGRFVARRMDEQGQHAPCPVLCIGNLTLGGAGKTPTAMRVAAMLREAGARPVFLSRGYGGRLRGPTVVEPRSHDPSMVGDESLLLARIATSVVSRDRPSGGQLCFERGASVIVMDDGLQNPSLTKDLSLAVVDAAAGFGNGLTFPAGPLRAPLARQWPHVDGLVLIGQGLPGEEAAQEAGRRGIPVHRAGLRPRAGHGLSGRSVFAFAGIGRPEKFFETLQSAGAHLAGTRAFGDHHRYSPGDLSSLTESARRVEATLVTTEKDAVRLPHAFAQVLAVELHFEDEASIARQLARLLASDRAPQRG